MESNTDKSTNNQNSEMTEENKPNFENGLIANNINANNIKENKINENTANEKKVADSKPKPILKPLTKPVNPFINGGGFGNKKSNSLPKNNMRARRR